MAGALAASSPLSLREEEALILVRNAGFNILAKDVKDLFGDFTKEFEDEATASAVMWLVTAQILARKAWITKSDGLDARLEAVKDQRQVLEKAGIDPVRTKRLLTEVTRLTIDLKGEDDPVIVKTNGT
ncbi:MAG: hypothetical protein WD883_00130 [Candidatus Colwellbacteria bacterium]